VQHAHFRAAAQLRLMLQSLLHYKLCLFIAAAAAAAVALCCSQEDKSLLLGLTATLAGTTIHDVSSDAYQTCMHAGAGADQQS
jgi:hypothetical protein